MLAIWTLFTAHIYYEYRHPIFYSQNSTLFFGGVVEPYWLSSRGVGIHVPEGVPLFYSWNDGDNGKMCLSAKDRHPYRLPEPRTLNFSYKVNSTQ